MLFGGQVRSTKLTALVVGAVVFAAAFVGLLYNHMDSWELPSRTSTPTESDTDIIDNIGSPKPTDDLPRPPSHTNPAPAPDTIKDDELRRFYMEKIQGPSIKIDAQKYKPYGAFEWELKGKAKLVEPLGEELCIIDLDDRPLEDDGQIFSPNVMDWQKSQNIHGLSLGVLNHWLYAKIHGYKYYYVNIEKPEDRRASWKKPPIISEILKSHTTCIYLDSDAIFHHLDLPFEWLLNYWDIHPDNNSLALAYDPKAKNNMDEFSTVYLNTGFIVAHNNEKTHEIMDAWWTCPDDDNEKHPDCKLFRTNRPGKPTDQGGFGTYIRYDYPDNIRDLPCTEANGFPESRSGCDGTFIRHLWTGKSDWIKIVVGEQLPGQFLSLFHEQFLVEKDDFMITEKELLEEGLSRARHA